ncbi:MAG TPA: SDR family NAD(P)-dependent oxidoreductase [Jatrophihabitantaceae bacterium]|jgi:NAD(P)-dependent dehydrogenase (short-subunit alcohol dehydrogenase family)|nr:SDR family NAD(P)-dependent oxidoreductase [Jatrophihabitantaceae bacterium]
MDISDASAIVTGGASGLGAATARLLASRGARVVVLDLQEELGAKLAAEIDGVFVLADVADEAQVGAAVAAASELAPLRVLVNAAGFGAPSRLVGKDLKPIPLAHFETIIRVNLTGTYNCSRLAAAAMAATEPLADGTSRGTILNTASVAAFDGQIGQTPYSASKGGIVGMTLPMSRDLARHGIRVNTIAPGLIDTPIYDKVPDTEEFKARLGRSVVYPNRMGTADEFASFALEVITNDYMNGETIRFDGAIRMPPA